MDMETWRDSHTRADTVAEALQAALGALGLSERALRSIRPVVTRSGGAYVELGRLPVDVGEQIAEALGQPTSSPHLSGPIGMRWLDTGSGPGAMVPSPITEASGDGWGPCTGTAYPSDTTCP